MRVAVLTREYPPEVYGGAGVHVEFLVRELRRSSTSTCTASARRATSRACTSYRPASELAEANAALRTLGVDLEMAAAVGERRRPALAHLVREHGRRAGARRCTASRT